ncbi:MAG: nitroreductase [Alphaproteobacteria bacterium]
MTASPAYAPARDHSLVDGLLTRRSLSPAILGEPGPSDADIATLITAALRAPDHGRLRPWHYAIIRGEARNRLGDLFVEALLRRDPAAPAVMIDRERGRPLRSPVVIALGTRIRPGHTIPEIEQMLSVGAGAMNILNAAHALGFGAMWVTGLNAYDPIVSAALGYPAPDRLVGFIYVGTPKEAAVPPSRPSASDHMAEWTGPTR